MRNMKFFLFFWLTAKTVVALTPVSLTCENLANPLGIDIATPLFSWMFSATPKSEFQKAYEIVVSTSLAEVRQYKATAWATGKVVASANINIAYRGNPLQSFTRYYWRVKVYDANDVGSWSEIAWFETSMLKQSDWTASWISDGKTAPAKDEDHYKPDRMPLFRKEFRPAKPLSSARLYITGLGYYEAYINGKKLGDRVLDPGWTTYRKQVLYAVFDITPDVSKENNTAAIMLGNGWWNPLPFKIFGRWDLREYQQTGRPCVKAEIHLVYDDGSREVVATNESWLTAPGPVIRNNVYLGEHYDARLEQKNWNVAGPKSNDWRSASIVDGPSGILTSQRQPPIRITRIIKPVRITQSAPDTFLVDFGQNFAGVVRLKAKGPAGKKITLRSGEGIFDDGSINLMTAVATQIKKGGIRGGPGAPETAWQEDSYTMKGAGLETWSPKFTFHGFRYVEVTGWPGKPTLNDFEGLRMNSDLPLNGTFACSNEMFNRLHEVVQWTFLSNVFSVQSDCPGREKMGYGADMVVSSNAFIYNYDMRNFYRKAVRDFANEQRPEGGITEIAPSTGIDDRGYGDGSGPLGWQLGFAFLQKQVYDFYGDKKVIEESYDAFKKQMDFLKAKEIYGLFHWDISDHEALDPKPEAFSASVFYYHHALLAAEFAGILDKEGDSLQYAKLANRIRRDIVSKYFVKHAGRFDNGTQSAQVMALWYHLSDEDVDKIFAALRSEFERHRMHVSSGIFGVKMMFDVLRGLDQNEIAYRIANQRDFPGWGHMLEGGATTLWETWDFPETNASRNHPMFGSVDEWFYRSLLGINPLAPGFEKIQVKPQPAGDLTWAKGSYESVRGKIVSDWKIEGGKFVLNVVIPPNTTAEIWVPLKDGGSVTSGGKDISTVNELKVLRTVKGYVVLGCGSGEYVVEGEM
jgi:alpha-L-rhamnosidase